METYTVAFIGHRYLEDYRFVEECLDRLIEKLICEKTYVCFYVERDGDFDQFASSAVIRAKNKLWKDNSSLIWALPYITREFDKNSKDYLDYYDEVVFFEELTNCHPKAAIQKRNRLMIDRADLVIAYVRKETGGAYQSLKYAERCGKEIINIVNLKDEHPD